MEYENKSGKYYNKSRPEMQALLPKNASKILDVGCGEARMAEELKKKFSIEVWGIEFMESEASIAAQKLDYVINDTIENSMKKLPDNYFDTIFFNDVLEHLANPNEVLENIRSKLTKDGKIISSIPNVRYHKVFQQYLFKKNWKYERAGVMDFTHLRFFTSKSIKKLFEDAGYEIQYHKGINKTKSLMPYIYNIFLFSTAIDMFYVQFATIARKATK